MYVIENAGAQKGYLILEQQGNWVTLLGFIKDYAEFSRCQKHEKDHS